MVDHLANESAGQSDSESTGTTTGKTEGHSTSQGTTVAHSWGEANSTATVAGTSEMEGSSEGSSESASDIMLPVMEDGIFAPTPFITRVTSGSGSNAGSSKGVSRNSATIEGTTTMSSESRASSYSESQSLALSTMESASRSAGTTKTNGTSESLEAIMELLPTAVHGLTNELYQAGLLLRSLPPSVGYVSFVGPRGLVSTLFNVPLILASDASEERFLETRDRFLPPPTITVSPSFVKTPVLVPKLKVVRDRGEPGWSEV